MPYRNKTYVCFDADTDMNYYLTMKMWKDNDNIDFNFHNAHDLNNLRDGSQEETIKRKLRERMDNTKQMIVLIGEKTKNLHRFVRWEMELALEKDIPIIAVNLNGLRECDNNRCPAIIREEYVVHIPFKLAIIRHALDNFPSSYHSRKPGDRGPLYYRKEVYDRLGL